MTVFVLVTCLWQSIHICNEKLDAGHMITTHSNNKTSLDGIGKVFFKNMSYSIISCTKRHDYKWPMQQSSFHETPERILNSMWTNKFNIEKISLSIERYRRSKCTRLCKNINDGEGRTKRHQTYLFRFICPKFQEKIKITSILI